MAVLDDTEVKDGRAICAHSGVTGYHHSCVQFLRMPCFRRESTAASGARNALKRALKAIVNDLPASLMTQTSQMTILTNATFHTCVRPVLSGAVHETGEVPLVQQHSNASQKISAGFVDASTKLQEHMSNLSGFEFHVENDVPLQGAAKTRGL